MKSRKEFLEKFLKHQPELAHRCTGASTGQALTRIGEALTYPGDIIEIRDHHGTHRADLHQFDYIVDFIAKLELKGFTLNRSKKTIKYSLDW